MVHGPEPDLLLAIPAVSCYRECSPIKTLRHTQLVHACKRDSARVVKDSAGGTHKVPMALSGSHTMFSYRNGLECFCGVRVFQLFKVEVRFHFQRATLRWTVSYYRQFEPHANCIRSCLASDLTPVTRRPGWSTRGTMLVEMRIHRMARVDMSFTVPVSLHRLTRRRFRETFLDR
jgi:hypothetical protein